MEWWSSKYESNFLCCVEMHVLLRINSWDPISKHVAFYEEAKRFPINVMMKHILNINPDDPLVSEILGNFENYIKGFISLPINIPGTAYFKALQHHSVRPMQGGNLLNVIMSKQNLRDEEMDETTAKLLCLIVYFLGGASNALESLKVIYEAVRCGNVVKFLHRKAIQDVKFKGIYY
ncbi:Cytochrome P450 724B1 [Glycine max]|nr:Cytochrome P450 724B1 [Glycine max]